MLINTHTHTHPQSTASVIVSLIIDVVPKIVDNHFRKVKEYNVRFVGSLRFK